MFHDCGNHTPEVEDHRFALCNFKVIAPFDSTIGHGFERNRSLALEGHLRSHTQKRSHAIEKPSTRRGFDRLDPPREHGVDQGHLLLVDPLKTMQLTGYLSP